MALNTSPYGSTDSLKEQTSKKQSFSPNQSVIPNAREGASAFQDMDPKAGHNGIDIESTNTSPFIATPDDTLLVLQDKQGNPQQLTVEQLTSWFATAERAGKQDTPTNATDAELATQLLSRFGLRSALDVVAFLRSPAGDSVRAIIGEELAEMAAHDKLNTFLQRETLRIVHLLLGLTYAKHAKAQSLNEWMHHLQEQFLHRQEVTSAPPSHAETAYQNALSDTVTSHLHSTAFIQQSLDERLAASGDLAAELIQTEEDIVKTQQKYDLFDSDVEDMLSNHAPETTEIAKLHDRLSQLTAQVQAQAESVEALLNEGKEEQAREQMLISNRHGVQIALLQEMLGVVEGTHTLHSEKSETTPTFANADFILEGKKIVHHNGKQYLLRSTQELSDLTTPQEKEDAHQAFHQLKMRPDTMTIKRLLEHNRQLEHNAHAQRKTRLSTQSEKMQQEIATLTHQLVTLQATKASIASCLPQPSPQPKAPLKPSNNPSLSSAAPSLTPGPLPQAAPLANSRSFIPSYRQMLLLMQTNPSANSLAQLQRSLTQLGIQQNAPFAQEVSKIKPGMPIQPLTMQTLLTTLERFGVVPKNQPGHVGSHDTPYAAPTPFSLRPKKS